MFNKIIQKILSIRYDKSLFLDLRIKFLKIKI